MKFATGKPVFIRWPAIIALTAGLFVGIITSGLFPAFEHFHFGVFSLQARIIIIPLFGPIITRTGIAEGDAAYTLQVFDAIFYRDDEP